MKSPEERILENWELINRMAVHRFGDRPLAEEAALFVTDGLLVKLDSRINESRGRSTFEAYLASMIWNLLEDFSRKKFGRRRAPVWIRNLGGIWLRLYRLLCLERLSLTEAIETAVQMEGDGVEVNAVEDAAWMVRQQVVHCGDHQGMEVEFDDSTVGSNPSDNAVQTGRVEEDEKAELFSMLFSVLTDDPRPVTDHNMQRLGRLNVRLSSEEKLLLKLCFQEGMSVVAAGRMLDMNNHQVHGRMRRLLARIREELERIGLDRDVLELLR